MENIKLRQLAIEFCDKHTYANEDDIYNFLVENEYRIAHNYDRTCIKDDFIFELEELGYNIKAIPQDLIENMLYSYEEKFEDYGTDCGWKSLLYSTIDWYKEDLEEYKLDDCE